MTSDQPSVRRRTLRVVLLSLSWLWCGLGPSAMAAIPGETQAFAKLMRMAEKELKLARHEAHDSLAAALNSQLEALDGDAIELDEAHAAAVASVADELSSLFDEVRGIAEGLASEGADLIAGVPTPSPDFCSGGGGLWDRFARRLDVELDRARDAFEKEFGRFVEGLGRIAAERGDPLNVRWRLASRVRPLDGMLGPCLSSLEAPPPSGGSGIGRAQFLITSRFASVGGGEQAAVGGIARHLAQFDIRATGHDEGTSTVSGVPVGALGQFSATVPLDSQWTGPVQFELVDGIKTLDRSQLSQPAPGSVESSLDIVFPAFRKSMAQQRAAARQLLAKGTRAFKKALRKAVRSHGRGEVGTLPSLEDVFDLLMDANGNDAMIWHVLQREPVVGAATSLEFAGLDDDQVTGEVFPDGAGAYGRFLDKLGRHIAAADRARARAFLAGVRRIERRSLKLGDEAAVSVVVRPRRGADGRTLTIAPTVVVDAVAVADIDVAMTVALPAEYGATYIGFFGGSVESIHIMSSNIFWLPGEVPTLFSNLGLGSDHTWRHGNVWLLGWPAFGGVLYRCQGPLTDRYGFLSLATPQVLDSDL